MTGFEMVAGTIIAIAIIALVYHYTGWTNIINCYKMWFTKEYWKSYNIIEALSWITKAIIIIPGLIFGIEIWWLYFFTLITSVTLIWASNQKLLPTLVGFNSLWVWLSCVVLTRSLL